MGRLLLDGAIKLGIAARAKWYYVGRQVDGATSQPKAGDFIPSLLSQIDQDIENCPQFGNLSSFRLEPVGGAVVGGGQVHHFAETFTEMGMVMKSAGIGNF